MEGGIFLLQADNSLLKMTEQPYEAEELLQELLADHSDLLAGDQISSEAPRRWLFIGREIGVPGEEGGADLWSLDHLFLDQDAIPTFVEVKRSSDTRIRREVVAQVLDYAANAVSYWPVSRMREMHTKSCDYSQVLPEEHLQELLGTDGNPEEFWSVADHNLRAGRVRLLFVSDRIPPQLRRIVEFLNQQMNPAEVLALEVKQFVGGTGSTPLRMLVPRVIGQSETLKTQKTSRRMLRPSEFVSPEGFAELLEPEMRESFERIVSLGTDVGFSVDTWTSPTNRYFQFKVPGTRLPPIYVSDEGMLWISFGRHHSELRNQPMMAQLRSELADAFPERRSNFMEKSEVGVRPELYSDPDRFAALRFAFETIFFLLAGNSNSAP